MSAAARINVCGNSSPLAKHHHETDCFSRCMFFLLSSSLCSLQLCPIEKSTHSSGTFLVQHAIDLRRICWRVAMGNQVRDSHIATQHVGIKEISHALVTPIRVIR